MVPFTLRNPKLERLGRLIFLTIRRTGMAALSYIDQLELLHGMCHVKFSESLLKLVTVRIPRHRKKCTPKQPRRRKSVQFHSNSSHFGTAWRSNRWFAVPSTGVVHAWTHHKVFLMMRSTIVMANVPLGTRTIHRVAKKCSFILARNGKVEEF